MAVVTVTEALVVVPAGTNVEVLAANVGRRAASIQSQSAGGAVRVSLGGTPTRTDGFLLEGGKTMNVGGGVAGQGNGVDFFEATVDVFNPTSTDVNIWTMEAE